MTMLLHIVTGAALLAASQQTTHSRQNAPEATMTTVVTHANAPTAYLTTPRHERKPKFGPPPPGYARIVGGVVPDWEPQDVLAASPRSNPWTLLGPRPITDEYWSGNDDASGRVVGIAPHPTNGNIVYIASASGGVWKTTDGGSTWTPLTDELSCLNHGAIATDPNAPDTIYVGTGEYTTNSTGDGLFRSTDAGATWTQIATAAEVGSTCSRIVVEQGNSQRIHVTGNGGYVRSVDGGMTWSVQLAGAASDLAVDPVGTNRVYVGRHGDGIYRSINGGDSFTKITSGLPTSDVYRIVLAIAQSNPSVLYAAIINGSAGLRGFYQSVDGGTNWSQKTNTPNFPSPQGWYDCFVGVDPTNENIVYAGGVFPSYAVAGVIKTTNGGNTWSDITTDGFGNQLHPDQHAVAFGPTGTVWVGNDGGVWRSNNGGSTWSNTNATLTVTQNYQIALHPSDPAQMIGGTQDNGTVARDAEALDWPQIISGDGGFAAYDAIDPGLRYTTYVYLSVYRDDHGFWEEISGPWSSDSRNFIAPLVMDPNDPDTLLGGTNRVWRTMNASGGADWDAISTSTVGGGGRLNAIAVGVGASNTIYTGSTSGKVYVTTNAANWFDRSSGLPAGEISDVCLDPADPGIAYVSFYNTNGGRVYRTEDYGVNWTNVTGGLPSGVGVTALAVDWSLTPPYLYAGSGAGVYESADGGTTWTKDGADLPNVNIGDLQIDAIQQTIVAGTYGRGTWRKALETPAFLGDMNCDGVVDLFDIDPFVLALTSATHTPPFDDYYAAFPNCDALRADLDGNSAVDLFDIDPFVAFLTGP